MKKSVAVLLILGLVGSAGSSPLKRVPLFRASANPPRRAEGHIVVKFKPRVTAARRQAAMAVYGVRERKAIPSIGARLLSVPPGIAPEAFVARLQAEFGDQIEYAHVDPIFVAHDKIPNDPLFSSQYHLSITHCPAAWDTITGSGVRIAIADTGVENHPDLAAHLLTGKNLLDNSSNTSDNYGHGTWVAGTAAAVGDNGIGVAGVAYSADILPIVIAGSDGLSTEFTMAQAITYAADNGAKVVNLSFGNPYACDTQTLIDAAKHMRERGGLVTQSAGNDPVDKGCADIPEIITVSATDQTDRITSFSNFGNDVDVAAPGIDIVTTDMSGDYASVAGTSFSAPLTAGIIALIYSIDPSFTPDQVQQILFDSADDLGTPGRDKYYGWGRVNAARTVALAAERSVTFQLNKLTNVYAYPNPWDARRPGVRQMTFANVPDGASVKIFTLSGFWVKNLTPANGRATWDLTNDAGDRVASGLYFYLIKSSDGEHKTRGTVAIIK